MKKLALACAIAATLLASSCMSGPKRLTRSWDDWVNQQYTENAWLHGALLQDIVPVYPIVGFVAGIGDAFVNFYYFWSKDAWDNKGTGFEHEQVQGAEKMVAGSGM